GNGCGHTVLGAESGTLASQNYPGTYPSNVWCRWKLRVSEGRTLRLLFGDFDVEDSPGCANGSLRITEKNGEPGLGNVDERHSISTPSLEECWSPDGGPVCGTLDASQKNVTLKSNEVTISFRSGRHRSGRGFLLSYATDQYPALLTCCRHPSAATLKQGLISCLRRGSHFSSQHVSVYCPAGCRNVTEDVWGSWEQGYRDTSVLCKSAVHAGVISDGQGGHVAVTRGRSLTLYESAFANGILSKMGSLSDKKLLLSRGKSRFPGHTEGRYRKAHVASCVNTQGLHSEPILSSAPPTECNNILSDSGSNASSSSRNWGSGLDGQPRPGDEAAPSPWLELELRDRSTITGVITTGSAQFYIESYIVYFSKDRKNWKLHKDVLSKEKKNLHLCWMWIKQRPTPLPRPQRDRCWWRRVKVSAGPRRNENVPHSGAAMFPSLSTCTRVCALYLPSCRSQPGGHGGRGRGPGAADVRQLFASWSLVEAKEKGFTDEVLFTLKFWFFCRPGCQSFQAKSLTCPQSEFISYPLERNVHDALPSPPLNNYAEPAVGQKVGSTFRPSSDEGYTTPFAFNHYDSPGNLPEYAEPLPPEPEYATPFSEQVPDSHRPPSAAAGTGGRTQSRAAQYDCPSHRVLSNGYCTPALHASRPRPNSAVYAEPKSCDSLQKHTYEEPL
ncbi:unnamed protein product, partial [Tetraodon nigroviridis]